MDKLHIINNSLSNIREILGEDCTHIQELPNVVQFLKDDATKNGHTTSFVFSTQPSPNQPSGSSLDTTTGLVTDLESGWYQTNNIESKSQNQVWMSFAIFDSLGNRTTEWATPINIKGVRGERGLPGEKGEVGETGPKGDKGDSKSFRTVSVYTTTNTLDSPSKPIGGKWDILTNEVILNDDNWYLNSDQVSKGTYLWMSQATFAEDGRLLNNWCSPFRLTGENGKNGVDGVRSEFIYRLLPDITSYENLREFTKNLYSPEYEDNYVPVANDNLNIGTVWSNHPSGISEGFPIEVCCNRTRKSSEESWSGWSSCIIWAKWGEDGIDGDGVEYIYRVTPKKIDGQDITSKYVEDYFMPNLYEAVDFEGYQEDGYYFADYGWTAEPTDVSPANPVEWVSIRKKINGVWGRFTSPKVWATFSEDGNSILNITKRYAVNNDAKNHPEEGWEEDSTTLSTNYDTARYMWCWERIEYSKSEPTDSYYVVTIHGEPGNNTGTKAPIIYPAGVWIPGKVYSSTVDKVPYVYYLDVDVDGNPTDSTGYYVLGEELGDYQSNVTPNNDPNWNKMESFEAVYSDIGLFNQALVGKWVFHGDYMFSQVGTLDGVESNNYEEFYINNWLPEDDPNYDNDTSNRFIPNVVFNAKTGESWHVGGSIRFGKDQNSSSINLQKTTIDRTYGRPRGIYETTSISNSGIGYLRAVKDGNMSAYNDTEIGINLDGFTAKGFNASGHYIKTNINNNGLTISSYDGESEVENLKISDNSFSIGEISIENNNILKSKNEANEITFGNGKVELSDNYDTTVRISCENDGEDIPSYINIGNFNPQPARSGGHYDDLKSYISTGTTDATETFTAIKTHDGYYAGFKPTFEIKTLDSNNTSVFLTNLTQIYKIDVTENGTYEVLVHDYLSKSDVIPEGMFHEIYLNVSSGLDVEVKFKQPFINDVLYSVKTSSKYKSLIRCHYCFGEWHFFEIKSA